MIMMRMSEIVGVENVLIVGVGGQGILLASRVMAARAALLGMEVKISEVHGMAQRGGSVVTHVRTGKGVHSPLVPRGTADAVLAFELLEGLRWLAYTSSTCRVILNDQRIPPIPVILGKADYPEDPVAMARAGGWNVTAVPAVKIALAAGSARAVNTTMLGALACSLGDPTEPWVGALERTLVSRLLDVNVRAFMGGYRCAAESAGCK